MEKISEDTLEKLVSLKESEVLEFKQAKVNFSDNSLFDYAAAIANEGGGKLILGVNNEGEAVGTTVYSGTENKIPHKIFASIELKVAVNSYKISGIDKRIVIIEIPSRPIGRPVRSKGKYSFPMRVGESLSEMDNQTLGKIFKEISPDYSSSIVDGLEITDLNLDYIEKFKNLWSRKANRVDFLEKTNEDILSSLNLIDEDKIFLTALILFGTESALRKFAPDAEIVFEWRTEQNKTNYDFRKSWRDGFIGVFDDIWNMLNARNSRQSYQDGLVQKEISAFDEKPFREALLNAVAHRDYSLTGQSIFIKANPESYSVESPGGLIGGVNLNNMLHKSAWRNRNLAEILEKAGLVERSGQGIDDIFEISIRNGKGSPILEEPYSSSFKITIPAKIEDLDFIQYLDTLSLEKSIKLSVDEILELENIRKNGPIKVTKFRDKFIDNGFIDRVGRGRASMYILSHNYYKKTKLQGVYSRLKGLPRDKIKELIIAHIKRNEQGSSAEFQDAFPELTKKSINNLLQSLRREEKIYFAGHSKFGVWKLVN